jgi:phage shock protein A
MSKLRVVVLGHAHDLLDKQIDLNSPSALRQYVRDLEDALDKLKNEAATQAGMVRTLTREQGDLTSRIATDKALATKYLESNPALARAKASDAVLATKQLADIEQQLKDQVEVSNKLDAAVAQLDSKHTEMLNNVRTLERLDGVTKAKEQAASSLTSAGKLVSGGSDISIDDIQNKMKARNDVASEKFDRAMGSVSTTEDPEHAADIDALLASLAPKTQAAN